MHKKGDIRDDGRVFFQKNTKCVGGEYWMEMNHFLRTCGQDYYERTAAYREYLAEMARTKEVRALKKRENSIKLYHETKHLTVEKRSKSHRESYAKMLLDPVRLEKHRAKQARARKRYKEKQKTISAEKRVKREAERKAKQESLQKIKQEQAEARRIEKAKIADEKALAKSLRPKRIALTEEQRKEKRRLEKRNYKHVRRARINNCEVKATPKMVEEARKLAGDRCYYCGKKAELTLDHFEPLAKGGAHCVSNFVFACHPCNSRKRYLDPFEIIAANVPAGFHD